MTTLDDAFRRAHHDLPREAPGSEATTSVLLGLARRAGALPPAPRIVDLGCGTGPATVPLVRETGGTALAVDLHEPYLAALRARAEAAGCGDRVRTLAADLHHLERHRDELPDGCADLLWSEGAAYLVGFDTALRGWRRLVAPGGVLVLTEAEWTTPHPSDGAGAFWDPAYPAMRSTADNVAAAVDAGWTVAATHLLPDADWATYYEPLDVRARRGDEYGYTAYVLRPRT